MTVTTLSVLPADGLDLVPSRPLVESPVDVRFWLAPGDRPLVAVGDRVVPGTTLAERLRDARFEDLSSPLPDARPGERWTGELPTGSLGLRRRAAASTGELLFESGDRWRVAVGEHREAVESPVEGTVREVRPGLGITLRVAGRGLPGSSALGSSARGVVAVATGPDGELRPGSVDVGASGQILVVGSRIDAETLTRARAMGVRGIVVGGLAGKERRDFLASENRQRAALHRLPGFAVLVLDGSLRRPIASPVMALLEALAGQEAGIVGDPPRLVFDAPAVAIPAPDPSWLRVRSGPLAGQEGRWAGLAGARRFAAGTHLEAGFVRFGDEAPVALPLADLERYV